MKETLTKNLADGPQLYSFRDSLFHYGAYHIFTFPEQDRDKSLKVKVTSSTSVCWIELWPAAYDGRDWVRWTTERCQDLLVKTGNKAHSNPSFIWTIQPGTFMVYFVNSKMKRQAGHVEITCHIEID